MKKNIVILGLVLCTSTGLFAQKGDSTSKTKNNTQQKRGPEKQKTNENKMSRRDSINALPPEEESRRSPSSAVPPNTPQ